MRRFKREWREAAKHYALSYWYTPELRWFDVRAIKQVRIAQVAAMRYRQILGVCYQYQCDHPKSKKAQESIATTARELASIGFWLLEREA